jgi:multiple sugar transport system permease protein
MTYRKKTNLIGYAFIAPYAVCFLAFVFLPVCISLGLAFTQLDLADMTKSKLVGVQNFKDAFQDEYFWKATYATLRYAALMVPSALIIGLLLSFGLFFMGRGRNTVRAFIYIPAMLNVAAAGILWQWFFTPEFGLFNFIFKKFGLPPVPWLSDKTYAMPAVVTMSIWWTVGGTAIIMLSALQQIPASFLEAAAVDGATRIRIVQKIIFPMLRPVLFFVFVTATIAAFQMFGQAMILTNGGPEFSTRGLPQYMFETAFNGFHFGLGAAVSWLLTAMIAIFAITQGIVIRKNI